jgi:CDGSH-type Zn-finger protein
MSDPTIAAKHPVNVTLEPGTTYKWCTCGASAKQPFCDGAHRGTEFRSLPFTVDAPKDAYLCLCKRTKNPPYCDGAHKGL